MRHPSIALALCGLLVSGALVTACKKEMSAPDAAMYKTAPAANEQSRAGGDTSTAPGSPTADLPHPVDAGRKLVKTVDLEMQVDDTTATS